jgi:GNAT superfamily N-acetyltransferase
MRYHLAANMGIYFDGCDELSDDLRYCWSQSIADFYWNYGFSLEARPASEADTRDIVTAAQKHGRAPAIWQLTQQAIPQGWSSASEEAWMTADLASLKSIPRPKFAVKIEIHDQPTPAMVAVFSDAYSTEGSPSDVGYFALPPEYVTRFAEGRSRPPASSYAVSASVDGQAVAVASICLVERVVGLYSVATTHSWRRRGLGKYISGQALELARDRGSNRAFLQTESDSVVEEMYHSIGFSRRFVGRLLVQSS